MVADAVLWVLFVAAIAFIIFGCQATKRAPKVIEQAYDGTLDRAA